MAQPWLESTKPFIKGSEKCQRKLKSRECEAGREQADPSTGNAGLEPGPAWGLAGLGSGLRAGSWFPREIKVSWANTREKKLPWKGRIQSAASNPRKTAPSGLQNHGIWEILGIWEIQPRSGLSPEQGHRGGSREITNQEILKDPQRFSPAQRDGIMECPELDPTGILQPQPCTDTPTTPPSA